ncbi:MAG: VanZ family protein [Gemmataceae bacterium]
MKPQLEPRLVPGRGIRWLLWLCYISLWTAGLVMPVPLQSTAEPSWTTAKFVVAKGLHVAAYGGLAMLSGWLRLPVPYRWWLLGFVVLHAPLTEYLQYVIDIGRSGSGQDVLLDWLGIVIGVTLTWRWWKAA